MQKLYRFFLWRVLIKIHVASTEFGMWRRVLNIFIKKNYWSSISGKRFIIIFQSFVAPFLKEVAKLQLFKHRRVLTLQNLTSKFCVCRNFTFQMSTSSRLNWINSFEVSLHESHWKNTLYNWKESIKRIEMHILCQWCFQWDCHTHKLTNIHSRTHQYTQGCKKVD